MRAERERATRRLSLRLAESGRWSMIRQTPMCKIYSRPRAESAANIHRYSWLASNVHY